MTLPVDAARHEHQLPETVQLPADEDRRRRLAERLVGLAVMSLLPALFWTVVIAAVATSIGTPMTTRAMVETGLGIAGFLAIVTAAITVQDR